MGRIYTIVFNSSIGDGSAITNESYFYDWSLLDEGKYKCSFTFMSGHNPVTFANGNDVCNIFMDLGQGSNVTIASSSTGGNFLSTYIGSLETRSIITSANGSAQINYYYASTVTNPAFYLDNRPRNNKIIIYMATNGANQNTVFAPIPGPYTLTLQLEKY